MAAVAVAPRFLSEMLLQYNKSESTFQSMVFNADGFGMHRQLSVNSVIKLPKFNSVQTQIDVLYIFHIPGGIYVDVYELSVSFLIKLLFNLIVTICFLRQDIILGGKNLLYI